MKKIMGHVTGKLSLSILTAIILLVGVLAGFSRITKSGSKAAKSGSHQDLAVAKERMGKLPLVFEPNRGQTDKRAQFLARSSGYNAFLTGGASATFAFRGAENKIDYLSMKLPGANDAAQARAASPTGGHRHYYLGNDRSK